MSTDSTSDELYKDHPPPEIFISYSRLDAARCKPIVEALRNAGFTIWIDTASIAPGDNWITAIFRHLDRSDFVIVLLTKNAVTSPWVQKEYQTALISGIAGIGGVIIPVLLDPVQLPIELRTMQCVDLTSNSERALAQLVRQISECRAAESGSLQEEAKPQGARPYAEKSTLSNLFKRLRTALTSAITRSRCADTNVALRNSLLKLHQDLLRLESVVALIAQTSPGACAQMWQQTARLMPGPIPGASSVLLQIDRAISASASRNANSFGLDHRFGRSSAVDAETFDCFLSCHRRDKAAVRTLAHALRARGISIWLEEERLRPGIPWQPLLEEGIRASRSVAVLVGKDGLGPWDEEEMRAALALAVKDHRPVIPVLLADAPTAPELPLFLSSRTWVDLRPDSGAENPSALDRLVWGITGHFSVPSSAESSPAGVLARPSSQVEDLDGDQDAGRQNDDRGHSFGPLALELPPERLLLLRRYIEVLRDLSESLRGPVPGFLHLRAPTAVEQLAEIWNTKVSLRRSLQKRDHSLASALLLGDANLLDYVEAGRLLQSRMLTQLIDDDARGVAADPDSGLVALEELSLKSKDVSRAIAATRRELGLLINKYWPNAYEDYGDLDEGV